MPSSLSVRYSALAAASVAAFLWLTQPAYSLPLKPGASAEQCGSCHRSIVEAWKESSHAKAAEGRLFQDALDNAERALGASVRQNCLGCHSPLAVQAGDLQLDRKVSWEGVTCDYCHSIRDVTLTAGANPKARLELSNIKSGPLKDVASSAHLTAYSAVHQSSLVCAPCHEHRNSLGYPVLTTFSEWQGSRAAKENKTCQSCHMYQVAGRVAEARLTREPEGKVNLHRMPGSRSVSQLNQTLKTKVFSRRIAPDQVEVKVELTNTSAGHSVPTGSPLRQLILEVQLEAGGSKSVQSRMYTRKVADSAGVPLAAEHTAFLKAAKTISDTRLGPDETRSEEFVFVVPKGLPAEVRANLSYYYSPSERSEARRTVAIRTVRDRVP
jgi:hypothetical protein